MQRIAGSLSAWLGAGVLGAACWMGGCSTVLGHDVQTEMLLANHTAQPLTVTRLRLTEHAEPVGAAHEVSYTLRPDETMRLTGLEGDEVVIDSPAEPATTLRFSKRSQTVKVRETSEGLSLDIRKGYTDPDRRD